MIFAMLTPNVALANTNSVAGFKEKMDALFMKNVLSTEQIDLLQQKSEAERTSYFWEADVHLATDRGEWLSETHNLNEELEYFLAKYQPDFDSGILVSELCTLRYADQYASASKFEYLFNGMNYWIVPTPSLELRASYEELYKKNNQGYMSRYQYDGISVYCRKFLSSEEYLGSDDATSMLDQGVFSFLKDYSRIEQQLIAKGETSVNEIKVCMWTNNLSFLYLKCEDREYLIRIRDTSEYGGTEGQEIQSKLTLFKLYSAQEVTDVIVSIPGLHPLAHNYSLEEVVLDTKPTFMSEAFSLKNDGLLSGNDEGFDLLRPLTRIEAASIIVKAMGESTAATKRNAQIFTDVPPAHWGYGAAQTAYSLDITKGVGNGEFAPDRIVTADEFSTMVLNAADTENFDWQQALELLTEKGIITAQNAETMDLFTRGDMAKIIYEARKKGLL
jgi:hypothetical protein